MNPELMNKISQWRQKATAGTLSIEEMRDAVITLRMGRMSAANASSPARKKAPSKSSDDLLRELEGL